MNHHLINRISLMTLPFLVILTIRPLSLNKRDALHNLMGLMRYLCQNLMSSNLCLMTQNQYPSLMSYLLHRGVLDKSEGSLLALIMSMVINTLRKLLETLSGLAIGST